MKIPYRNRMSSKEKGLLGAINHFPLRKRIDFYFFKSSIIIPNKLLN